LLVCGAVLCAAAHVRVGFVLLVVAGFLLAALGAALALNFGELSDRMVDEVTSRWSIHGQPLSVTRFGGVLMLVTGAVMVILGIVELAR
jgi:hypothetical protein